MRTANGNGGYRLTLAMAACVGAAHLGGCRAGEKTIFAQTQYVSASTLEGEWRGPDGTIAKLRETAGGMLRISASQGDETRTYTGAVLNLSGRTIIEVPLSDEGAMSDDAAPVSVFTRVTVDGDVLESEPLSHAWLESRASDEPGVGPAPLAQGEGRAIVGDADAMRRLLVRAATDDAAWGPTERYERVR